MKTLNRLRRSAITLLILLFCYAAGAQETTAPEYKIQGNEIVKTTSAKTKAQPVKTGLTHTIKKVVYPVYKSNRGKYFIIRTSKNTGNEYKQYLKLD